MHESGENWQANRAQALWSPRKQVSQQSRASRKPVNVRRLYHKIPAAEIEVTDRLVALALCLGIRNGKFGTVDLVPGRDLETWKRKAEEGVGVRRIPKTGVLGVMYLFRHVKPSWSSVEDP